MESLYNVNGLMLWTEDEIKTRAMLEGFFQRRLENELKTQNRGFEFCQVEAPILTPREKINPNYADDDVFSLGDLVLRPETTMGSYVAAVKLLDPYATRKRKLPLVVWQHGKSFRREQDQVTKNMRLKEFYQLEFQIIYSPETKNDYSLSVIPAVQSMIARMLGPCMTADSDRIPSYAAWTRDVVHVETGMEVCSISLRKDFLSGSVLEVAIGTDRCVYLMGER